MCACDRERASERERVRPRVRIHLRPLCHTVRAPDGISSAHCKIYISYPLKVKRKEETNCVYNMRQAIRMVYPIPIQT